MNSRRKLEKNLWEIDEKDAESIVFLVSLALCPMLYARIS